MEPNGITQAELDPRFFELEESMPRKSVSSRTPYSKEVRALVRTKYLGEVAALSTFLAMFLALISFCFICSFLSERGPIPASVWPSVAFAVAQMYAVVASGSVLLIGLCWLIHYRYMSASHYADAAKLARIKRNFMRDYYKGLAKFGNPLVAPFFLVYQLVRLLWVILRSIYRLSRRRLGFA